MKNIKSFNDFSLDQTNEEINLKKILGGAAIAASTLLPGKASAGVEPSDTLYKTTKSKSEMTKMTKYQHWTLDSTHVDTLYQEVKKAGVAIVYADTLDLDVDGDLFASGQFNLNSDVKDAILGAIYDITSKEGIITDFQIESSTDAEPIDMKYAGKSGNAALSQRRADVVKEELIKIGVDSSIISIDASKIEQFDKNVGNLYKDYGNMTKDQKINARIESKEFRYVKIRIVYVLNKDIPPLPAEIDTILKNTYYLSKPFVGGGKPPKLRKHFKKTTIDVPVLEINRRNGTTECARWGKKTKGFWTDKKFGYE
jgi:outer membrane protein OmpA-like peptidoglycan-associated protein